jgi:hypothetical protein
MKLRGRALPISSRPWVQIPHTKREREKEERERERERQREKA